MSGQWASVTVEFWGEDGEWAVAEGHVDLDAFLATAKAEALDCYGLDGEEFPDEPPRHRYMRPITLADCDSVEEFAWKQADGWHQWTDDPSGPETSPVTILGMGW